MDLQKLIYNSTDVLSETEQDMIVEIFTQPVVKKYLRSIAQNDMAELAVLSASSISNDEVAKKHSLVQGKLSTVVTLLSINKPTKES